MNKLIIFEGVDKAGKSTCATNVLKKIPSIAYYKALGSSDTQKLAQKAEETYQAVRKLLQEGKTVILDRTQILSDLVYCDKLYDDNVDQSWKEARFEIYEKYTKLYQELNIIYGTTVIIFTVEPETIKQRMTNMGGPEDALEQLVLKDPGKYVTAYDNIFATLSEDGEIANSVVCINTTKLNADVVANTVCNIITGKQHNTNQIAVHSLKPLYVATIVPKIYPVKELSNFNLILSQNINTDGDYNYWAKVKGYKVLDNGAFELGKSQNFVDVLQKAHRLKAHEVVLPDVFRDAKATIESVKEGIKIYHELLKAKAIRPMKLMAVPQGLTLQEWLDCYHELCKFPEVNVIAVNRVSAQLLGSRVKLLQFLQENNLVRNCKEYHLLGMQDDITELKVVQENYSWVRSVDSCFPYLIALNRDVVKDNDIIKLPVIGCHRDQFKTTINFDDNVTKNTIIRLNKIREAFKTFNIIM